MNNQKRIFKPIKVSQSELKLFKTINAHSKLITSIAIFPSGNFLSVSWDRTIKIWDLNYNLLSTIYDDITDYIVNVCIKDENTFIISLYDKSIKVFKKNEDNYIFTSSIEKDYEDIINKLIFISNNQLILCSENKIDIFEEINDNKYQFNMRLLSKANILSMIYIKEKNYLIASGDKGTYIFNLNYSEMISEFNDAICVTNNSLFKIKDNIFVGGDNGGFIKVISINENKIIKTINNEFTCYGIWGIEDKSLLLTCGWNKSIKIYNSDTFICIQTIKNAHEDDVRGLIELNNCHIASYSNGIINIWNFEM